MLITSIILRHNLVTRTIHRDKSCGLSNGLTLSHTFEYNNTSVTLAYTPARVRWRRRKVQERSL